MSIIKFLKSKLRRKPPSAPTMTATKIKLIANPRYQKSGTKSYVHLIRKYGFHPTKEGPYQIGTVMQQTGRQYTDKPIGGRVYARQVLQKKNADTSEIGQVGADDIQNDSMYLAQIGIGIPAQSLNLDFDTGSADLWVSDELCEAVHHRSGEGKLIRGIGLVNKLAVCHTIREQESYSL